MDYVYGAMWLIVALLLMFKMSKESKIFIFLGAFFVVMAAWWIINASCPELKMFEGALGLTLRGIGLVVLVVAVVYYYKRIYVRRK